MVSDVIDEAVNSTTIALPDEFIHKSKGGSQIWKVLHAGSSAFDDEPPEVAETIVPGREILTGRYPGHTIDLDPLSSDQAVSRYRLINSSEVHALLALEGEEGADV